MILIVFFLSFLRHNHGNIRIIFACVIFYFLDLLEKNYSKICGQNRKMGIIYAIIFFNVYKILPRGLQGITIDFYSDSYLHSAWL